MTFDDIVIGGVCLAMGYWLVSWLITKIQGNSKQQNSKEFNQKLLTTNNSDVSIESLHDNWYRILGVSPIATVTEIKLAYKTMIKKYHPDKVATLGTGIRELAKRKTKEIDAAYRYAVNKYGEQFFK